MDPDHHYSSPSGSENAVPRESSPRPDASHESVEHAGSLKNVENSSRWEEGLDQESGRPYWFCRAVGRSSWTAPPNWEPAIQGTTNPPADCAGSEDPQALGHQGYHYTDANGQVQGPFDRVQLQEWRAHLPMDLPVWRTAGESEWLAVVLGDEALLRAWWDQRPDLEVRRTWGISEVMRECSMKIGRKAEDDSSGWCLLPNVQGRPNTAPPAPEFESMVPDKQGAASRAESPDDAQAPSLSPGDEEPADYAQAVLAGLPSTDDAVQVTNV